MSKIKLAKKFHLLWDTTTKEILLDFETKNSKTVTECWRDGVAGADYETKLGKDNKIANELLTYKKDDPRYVPPVEDDQGEDQ